MPASSWSVAMGAIITRTDAELGDLVDTDPEWLSEGVPSVVVVLLTGSCVLCGRLGEVVCPGCAGSLAAAPSLAPPLWVDECIALLDYRTAAPLLTSLKNRHRRDLIPWLVDRLAPQAAPAAGGVVTWAPTGAARRRARGYDQAELLARALARRWGLPARELLRRGAGPAQAGRTARDRRANPAFVAPCPSPAPVVLVDDVATTGATLTAAARALRARGALRWSASSWRGRHPPGAA